MKPIILGVAHIPENVKETMKLVLDLLSKTPTATIALETSNLKTSNKYFQTIASKLKKYPFAKIIFLGSQFAEVKSVAGFRKENEVYAKVFQPNRPSEEQLKRELREAYEGFYINSVLTNKYFLKKIRRHAPDMVIVGSTHAKVLGHALKTNVIYIGTTEEKTNQKTRIDWAKINEIAAQKNKLFKQRRNKLKLAQKRKAILTQTRH